MKKLIVILIFFFALTGCNNSVKDARAYGMRQATGRTNDNHNLAMADSEALTPTRLMVKEVLLWSLMFGGVIVIITTTGVYGYFAVGMAINRVRFWYVPLDTATRQYPLLLYGNGRRVFNPNNGERLLLSEVSEAQLERIEAATRVQMAGLLSDGSKIINAPTN